LQWPAQSYPNPESEKFEAYEKPLASKELYEDEFGKVLSGYAPIKDGNGRVVGILGVDMMASLLDERVGDVFQPFLYFFGFFLILVGVRFAAFNKSLCRELLALSQTRIFLASVLITLIILMIFLCVSYLQTRKLVRDQTAERLKAIASVTAMQIDYRDLEQLQFARDMKRPEYQRVFELLNKVRNENPDVKWAYVIRPTQSEGMWEFVVDANSNFFLPFMTDDNNDGFISESEENVFPGLQYDVSQAPKMIEALLKAVPENDYYSDQWGTYISGYAPIIGADDKGVAIVGFDITVPQVNDIVQVQHKSIIVILSAIFTCIILSLLLCRQKLYCLQL
jgi:hypothetical protein